MITFKFDSDENLTFAHVPDNGFFVSQGGYLCQKIDRFTYNKIATPDGIPYATSNDCEPDMPVNKILPPITRIEF